MSKSSRSRVLHLQPDNFTFNVWGGRWIPRLKGLRAPRRPVGESWEFSGHPAHPSRAHLAGRKISLSQAVPGRVPFLVKLIDARHNLSVQVHPHDGYARRREKQSGKTESWLILDTGPKPGDGMIYLGFKPRRGSPQKKFREAIQGGDRRTILSFLNRIRVHAGEVYHLPPGTIHAIGHGVRLYEIQQTSDVTYRVWDWNRRVKRPLHIREAFDVLSFRPQAPRRFRLKPVVVARSKFVTEEKLIHERHADYAAHRLTFSQRNATLNQIPHGKFLVYTVVEGAVSLNGEFITQGRTVVVPRQTGEFHLVCAAARATVIKSFCP